MRFDIENTQGEWFTFFESEIMPDGEIKYLDPIEGAGKVCLRISDPESIEKIQSQTRKKVAEFVYNPKTRAMDRVIYFDQTPAQEQKERELIWNFAITDWKDLLDMKGVSIPCTLENKMKLMNVPQFARFIGRCLQLISGAKTEQADIEIKNF